MALHLAARVHAFVHGLFRPSDEQETRALYDRVKRQFDRRGLLEVDARRQLIADLAAEVLAVFEKPPEHPQRPVVEHLITRLFAYEQLWRLPAVDWSARHSISEYWTIRDELNAQRLLVEDFDATWNLLRGVVFASLKPIYDACPALLDPPGDGADITAPTHSDPLPARDRRRCRSRHVRRL